MQLFGILGNRRISIREYFHLLARRPTELQLYILFLILLLSCEPALLLEITPQLLLPFDLCTASAVYQQVELWSLVFFFSSIESNRGVFSSMLL